MLIFFQVFQKIFQKMRKLYHQIISLHLVILPVAPVTYRFGDFFSNSIRNQCMKVSRVLWTRFWKVNHSMGSSWSRICWTDLEQLVEVWLRYFLKLFPLFFMKIIFPACRNMYFFNNFTDRYWEWHGWRSESDIK